MSRSPVAHRLILIEGIPGSGKTSTAKLVCSSLRREGVEARWHLEEHADNPVTPKILRRASRREDFPALCVESWRDLAAETGPAQVEIVEGVAFQSTVRFLYAQLRSAAAIRDYLDRFSSAVAPLEPLFLYLRHPDPERRLRQQVLPERGAEWVGKVAAYTEKTPVARSHGWSGVEGMIEFWVHYGERCDEWFDALPFPRLRIDLAAGNREAIEGRILSWIEERYEREESIRRQRASARVRTTPSGDTISPSTK